MSGIVYQTGLTLCHGRWVEAGRSAEAWPTSPRCGAAVPGLIRMAGLALVLGSWTAGCTLAGLQGTSSGLAAGDAEAISLVVAQTRDQFPLHSAAAVPFVPRSPAAKPEEELTDPILRGTGVGVTPGIQLGEPEKMEFALYLTKPDYAAGWVRVIIGQGQEETWRVVAYDKRDGVRGNFDYIYVLADAAGALRYLVILGGRFQEEQRVYRGMEGTLIVPDANGAISTWKKAYKIDLGYRVTAVPKYVELVDESEKLFRELKSDVPALETLQSQYSRLVNQIRALRESPVDPQNRPQREDQIATLEASRIQQEQRLATLRSATEAKMVRYYELGRLISDEFARHVTTNQYTWKSLKDQQADFQSWQRVEFHHPQIDELAGTLLTLLPDGSRLTATREQAMATIARNNNWAKNPSRRESPKN